jgi:hypothetical protein
MRKRKATELTAAGTERRHARHRFFGAAAKVIVAAALVSATASMQSPLRAAPASGSTELKQAGTALTPEVKLVSDYNSWFRGACTDIDKMRTGLPKYITADTILHEAVSLPWGGTMIGYEGWDRLCQLSAPISEKMRSFAGVSDERYYQRGHVVLREILLTIKPTKAASDPFSMGIIEKYSIENGRIKQIDEFFADTASFLDRLRVLGALPEHK